MTPPDAGPGHWDSAPARAAPPTSPRPLAPETRPSRWPVVLGVISMVLGGGGMLMAAWQIVQSFIIGEMMRGIPGQEAILAAQRQWRGPMVGVLIPGALLALLLLAGGVLLIRRKAPARAVLLAWSGLRVVQGLGLAIVTGLMQQDQMQAIMSAAGAGPGAVPPPAAFGSAMAAGTGAFVALWALAWPACLLIWFTRKAVRAEVRSWATRVVEEPGIPH